MNRALVLGLGLFFAAAAAVPLYRDSLPNGLVVLTYEDPRLPMATVRVACRSGSVHDPAGKTGLARLTAGLLLGGTAGCPGDSVDETLEFLGARPGAGADYDYSWVEIQALTRHLDTALDVLADAVLHPAFEPRRLERERAALLTSARRDLDDPNSLASVEFDKWLYGPHPYARPPGGDTADLPGLTRDDVVLFHSTHYRPNNCFIIAAGSVTRADVVERVRARFGDWEPDDIPILAAPAVPVPEGVRVRLIHKPELNQSYVIMGHAGIAYSHPRALAARLMSYILGGSALASRLGQSVREEGGLAYDVRCWFDRRAMPGAFQATVQTRDPVTAIAKIRAEVNRMHDAGPEPGELVTARNYYTGSFPLNYSSTRGKLYYVMLQEAYRLGDNWIEDFPGQVSALTLADLAGSATLDLHPEHYLIVIVSNLTKEELPLPGVDWVDGNDGP